MKTTTFNSLKQEVTEQTKTFSPSLSLLPSVKVLPLLVCLALLAASAQMRGENLTGNSTVDGDLSVGNSTNKGNVLITGKTGGSAGHNLKVIGEGLVTFQGPSGTSAFTWNPMTGSLSLGSGSHPSNAEAVFVGSNAQVSEDYGFAFGFGAWAGGYESIAMGDMSWADVAGAIAIGNGGAYADGLYSIALGSGQTYGNFSFTVNGVTWGTGSTAFHGGQADGAYSLAAVFGLASGNYSTSIGQGTQANSAYSIALGRYNIIEGSSSTTWQTTDPLLALGNGTDSNNRHNALTVLKNGKMSLFPTSSNTSSIVLDPNAPQITVGGQALIVPNGSGNVGLGVTSPAGKMHVSGGSLYLGPNQSAYENIAGSGSIQFGTSEGNDFLYIKGTSLGTDQVSMDFVTGDNNENFRFITGGQTVLQIKGQNVGIGTTNPFNGTLHVNAANSSGVGGNLWITNSGTNTVGSSARLSFGPDATTDSIPNAVIENIMTNTGSYASDLTFKLFQQSPEGNIVERMRITGEGNVGIGMTTPVFRLETAGPASFGDGPFIRSGSVKDTRYYDQQAGAYLHTPGAMVRKDSSTTNMAQAPATLVLYNKDGTDNAGAKLTFAANETTASNANPVALAAIASQKISGVAGNWATGNLKFLVKSGSSYVDVATMRASGNVGIGTSDPTAKLEVNGDARFSGVVRIVRQGDVLMGEFGNPE